MSEVIDAILEQYPVYKEVDRSALIDAIGKKYPAYLEHADFKDEFDQLQVLNKSVQEGTAPVPSQTAPEATVPAQDAWNKLFSKPAAPSPTTIPETTTSPLTEGAAQQADILRTGVSHETQVLGDTSKTPLISFPKPIIYPEDPDRLKVAKGMAGAISSGLESVLTESTLQDIATAGPMAPLVFGALGTVGAVKGGISTLQAKTPEERGKAIGETILNLGMTALAAKSVGAGTPDVLAPKTVEAAKSAIKEGAPNASSISEATAVHANVPSQSIEGAREMPVEESGGGIQPQAQGGIQEAPVGRQGMTPKEILASTLSRLPENIRSEINIKGIKTDVEFPSTLEGSGAILKNGYVLVEKGEPIKSDTVLHEVLHDYVLKHPELYDSNNPFGMEKAVDELHSKILASESSAIGSEGKPIAQFHGYVENKAGEFTPLFDIPNERLGHPTHVRQEKAEASGYAVPELPQRTPENTQAWPRDETVEPGPGAVGMGAATPEEFPTAPSPVREAMEGAVSPLQKLRRTISRMWETGEVKDAMAATKDAADNGAALYARQLANDIREPFKREFGKEATTAEEALTFAREAGMSPDVLRSDREQIASSRAGSDKWRRKGIDAIDYALAHLDELNTANERYGQITDAQLDAENTRGIPTLKRDNYVMHVQDIEKGDTFLSTAGGIGESTPFKKVRYYDKLADSIANGVDPKTINSVDLLEHRLRIGQKLINNRAWSESLKSLIDPTNKLPVATDPVIVKRADGSTYPDPPDGYKLEYLGNQPVAIQHGYEGILSALTDPSFFRKSMAGRSFLQATGAGKSISLMIDTFHLGRIAYWESLIKSLGIKTFEMPFPSYKKGLTLLDYSPHQILEMAANKEIPWDWVKNLQEDKRNVDGLVQHGYNVGRISDALFQDAIQHLPFLGKFNKFIFEQFQRGAMAEVGLLETQRLRNARPDLTDAEVWREVAKDLNTRFGNLGSQGIFKSRSGQDLARMLVLAPQWNEGLIRSEIGAITQTGKAILEAAQGKRIYGGVLMRSVGAMAVAQFVANQIINYYTRGKPTWENPEEGFGAKLSAWIPDKIGGGPGFFLHPLGLAAETTHLLLNKFEKTGDFRITLKDYLKSRSSTAMRPVVTFFLNEDFIGHKLKPGSVWGEMVKSAIPAPIGGSAVTQAAKEIITGQPSESFPGQFQKQVMASAGVKTDQAPSPEQRVGALAKDFNAAHGVTPSAEFYTGDYQPLTQALRIGNTNDAKAAIDELLKKKTQAQIVQHFMTWQRHPFTGSRSREGQFLATLSPEQRTQYDAAMAERRRIGALGQKMAREIKKEP